MEGTVATLRAAIWATVAAATSLLLAGGYVSWSLRPPSLGGDGSGSGLSLTERAGLWVTFGLGQSAPLLPWAALSTLIGVHLVRVWLRRSTPDGSLIRANRWDHIQLELCITAAATILMSVVSLGAAIIAAINASGPLPAEEIRGACAIVAAYSLTALCLGSVFFATWWSTGRPRVAYQRNVSTDAEPTGDR